MDVDRLRILDSAGQFRIELELRNGQPTITLRHDDGEIRLALVGGRRSGVLAVRDDLGTVLTISPAGVGANHDCEDDP